MKGQGRMHKGMSGNDRLHAGDLVGTWRNGRPFYLPGGGSTPPEPTTAVPPTGVIPVTIPPAPVAPPSPITAEVLAAQREQWQRDADERFAQRERELQEQWEQRLAPIEAERAEAARLAAEQQAERERIEREAAQQQETLAERAARVAEESAAEVQRMRDEIAASNALLAREQQRNAVNEYRAAQLLAHADDIHPAMHNMVQGYTNAEIDAALTRAQEATAAMLSEFADVQGQQQQQVALLQRQQPMASVTAPPVGAPEALGTQRMLTAQEIDALSDAEFAQMRPQLLAAAGQAYRQANGR